MGILQQQNIEQRVAHLIKVHCSETNRSKTKFSPIGIAVENNLHTTRTGCEVFGIMIKIEVKMPKIICTSHEIIRE